MRTTQSDWTIPSESGEPLRVSSHTPAAPPRAHAVFAHGLKGFKDYGFIPVLSELLAREANIAVHRFNFSHSGIAEDAATFQRPDLFERDTWRLQARDTLAMMRAVRDRFDDPAIVLMGHSRGGASTLLATAECFERGLPAPSVVVTLSAPASLNRISEKDLAAFHAQGWFEMPSSRTGQTLRVGQAWLQEQLEDPDWHDLIARGESIDCPALIAHGRSDTTVAHADAKILADAIPGAESAVLEGANHVWNTPNPAPHNAADDPSPALRALTRRIADFLNRSL
jgi:pimeloyl-ACP methyl ester carboxylesterase